MTIAANGNINTQEWTQDDERISSDQPRTKQAREYSIFNSRRACACCGEKEFSQRPDWDHQLEVNRGTALVCSLSGTRVVCR